MTNKRRNKFREQIYDKRINEYIWERDGYECKHCGKEVFPYKSSYNWCEEMKTHLFELSINGVFSNEDYIKISDALPDIWKKKHRLDMATIDHIIPITKNGDDSLENLVCCCFSCNSKKGNR